MSSISKAGVWIDCKQLLPETYQLVNYLNNADKIRIGDRLIQLNIDMINHFSMAYNRGDEHLVYDDGKKIYDVVIKGCKMQEVNALQSAFESYKALIELTFENLDLSRMSKGLEFLGYHLHKDRAHLNRKIYVRAHNLSDRHISNLQHALCAFNSYAGMMKMAHDRPLLMKYFSIIHDKRLKIDYINLKICA